MTGRDHGRPANGAESPDNGDKARAKDPGATGTGGKGTDPGGGEGRPSGDAGTAGGGAGNGSESPDPGDKDTAKGPGDTGTGSKGTDPGVGDARTGEDAEPASGDTGTRGESADPGGGDGRPSGDAGPGTPGGRSLARSPAEYLRRPWVLAALGLVLIVLAGAVVAVRGGGTADGPAPARESPSPAASSEPPAVAGPRPPSIDPELRMGAEDAPVTMVVFGDFRCPYCAKFAAEQQPRLVREYVETGRMQLVWRDYPYRGEESERAAAAGRAAAAQGEFWAYNDLLYSSPDSWDDEDSLVALAGELDLDTERFRSDLADPDTEDAVQADLDFALGLGVPGTPAFLINGEAFFGAQPIEEFERRIEEAEPE